MISASKCATLAFVLIATFHLAACISSNLDAASDKSISRARTYTLEAQKAYLRCEALWPNNECQQDAWVKYGSFEFDNVEREARIRELKDFISAMSQFAIQDKLKRAGKKCDTIHAFKSVIFSKDHVAVCDKDLEYRFSPNNGSWTLVGTPK